jgi:DNA end-binding protein Ku
MAQRSLWRGAISFGLIYVPIEMYSASKEHALNLHFLDSRDFAPVGYERINKTTGKSVDWQHIVKGYEFEKGQYVALSEADFKHANVKASETIDISSFTEAGDISPVYYQTPYYLQPSKGGEKVYVLLAEALQSSRKVALATFVMRGRQHLCVIAPTAGSLMLITLRFADEILPAVKPAAAANSKSAKPKDAEIAMARKLVEEMSAKWNPQAFHDTYREDLMRRIREKIKKNEIHALGSEPRKAPRPKADVIDLMEALKNSLKLQAKQGMRAAPKSARERKRA